MPAEHLAALDVAARAAVWRQILLERNELEALLVSAGDAPPEGFALYGPPRSQRLAEAGFAGEFHAIYLLRALQGRGAGRALMGAMAGGLLRRGVSAAGAWVFRDNYPARRFYEALGGADIGLAGVWGVEGIDYPDLAYVWRDLRKLARVTAD